jgi:hypothetical protein
MCPVDYNRDVDISSWGICSCWGNGARRSKNGTTTKCEAVYYNSTDAKGWNNVSNWTDGILSTDGKNQVCIYSDTDGDGNDFCIDDKSADLSSVIPKGI